MTITNKDIMSFARVLEEIKINCPSITELEAIDIIKGKLAELIFQAKIQPVKKKRFGLF